MLERRELSKAMLLRHLTNLEIRLNWLSISAIRVRRVGEEENE
jgi:hypothetical protein